MSTFRVYADEKTTDGINAKAMEMGGAIPAPFFVSLPPAMAGQFPGYLDHLGVEYESRKAPAVEFARGDLVAQHIGHATFGRPW